MGKLQFIQDTTSELDRLYILAADQIQSLEVDNETPKSQKRRAKNKTKTTPESNTDEHRPVFPMTQSEILEDGTLVKKRVKPLTYSLMNWVKVYMGLPDSIDISDDEDYAQFEISVPHPNDGFEYKCYFNTDEEDGLIKLYIYQFNDPIPEEKISDVKELILKENMEFLTGQIQLVASSSPSQIIRYYSGICVKGIASDDPNYSGEFQISPQLYQNMLEKILFGGLCFGLLHGFGFFFSFELGCFPCRKINFCF